MHKCCHIRRLTSCVRKGKTGFSKPNYCLPLVSLAVDCQAMYPSGKSYLSKAKAMSRRHSQHQTLRGAHPLQQIMHIQFHPISTKFINSPLLPTIYKFSTVFV